MTWRALSVRPLDAVLEYKPVGRAWHLLESYSEVGTDG